jgi:hypothetical protein
MGDPAFIYYINKKVQIIHNDEKEIQPALGMVLTATIAIID